jgi:DNA-binding response OmpR family regulator
MNNYRMSKLLIVDDSVALLEVMANILERNGYVVKTLNKAPGLFEAIKEFQPDMVILDIYLAGEDGREICKKLKRNAVTKDMCVLVFSASPKALQDYKAYDADGFIEKPFDISVLTNKIKAVLEACNKPHGSAC